MNKKELKQIIKEDKEVYFGKKSFKNIIRYFTGYRFMRIGKYIILLRKVNYYQEHINDGWINKFLCFYYKRLKNMYGEKLNLEIDAKKIGRRFIVYHSNVVINGYVTIGDNCELHGNNCIGNKGRVAPEDECPIIGNNVDIGVGTNIVGKIKIGNNIRISANSFVNKTFEEEFSLIGGVPAKLIKKWCK